MYRISHSHVVQLNSCVFMTSWRRVVSWSGQRSCKHFCDQGYPLFNSYDEEDDCQHLLCSAGLTKAFCCINGYWHVEYGRGIWHFKMALGVLMGRLVSNGDTICSSRLADLNLHQTPSYFKISLQNHKMTSPPQPTQGCKDTFSHARTQNRNC